MPLQIFPIIRPVDRLTFFEPLVDWGHAAEALSLHTEDEVEASVGEAVTKLPEVFFIQIIKDEITF